MESPENAFERLMTPTFARRMRVSAAGGRSTSFRPSPDTERAGARALPGGGRRDMAHVWGLAALWLGLALAATLLSIWLRIATALSEIVVGAIAQLVIGVVVGQALLGTSEGWITFL